MPHLSHACHEPWSVYNGYLHGCLGKGSRIDLEAWLQRECNPLALGFIRLTAWIAEHATTLEARYYFQI